MRPPQDFFTSSHRAESLVNRGVSGCGACPRIPVKLMLLFICLRGMWPFFNFCVRLFSLFSTVTRQPALDSYRFSTKKKCSTNFFFFAIKINDLLNLLFKSEDILKDSYFLDEMGHYVV